MIPILFEYNATSFTTHGIGDLVDCTDCISQLNSEGEWELSFNYPRNGELINELTIGRLIYVKANSWQGPQIFRIYGYSKGIGGIITINCQHISYDLANIPVKNFKSAASATANTVLANMKSNAVAITGLSVSKFSFSSNVSGTAHTVDGYFEVDSPSTVRSVLLDGDSSIKGCFGGDLVFDNYSVQLLSTGGSDRGVMIEYGVDLMDIKQEENISEMYTGVLPYYTYTDANDNPAITYGSPQYASGTFISNRVLPMSFNEYFPNQAEHTSPTAAQLNTKAREWIAAEDGFGEPEVNLTLSYAELGQDVRLYDAITVRFVKMGIDVKAKVASVKYDVLKERIIEIEVGKPKKSVLFSLEDASRLRKGLLPPARIKDKSITSSKYADNSVTHSALGGGSVGASNMQDASVPTRSIQDYAVTGGKIGGGAVTETKIGQGAVTETKIADDAVTEKKVKPLSITVTRLDNNAVSTDKVVAKAITYAKSAYQGTLDQVDINAADIAAINNLFIGSGTATWFRAESLSANQVTIGSGTFAGSTIASHSWCYATFQPLS